MTRATALFVTKVVEIAMEVIVTLLLVHALRILNKDLEATQRDVTQLRRDVDELRSARAAAAPSASASTSASANGGPR